ncbi:MAG: T9SS type A sorting domain-containing protein [Bacteroidetes bacterium]|nr:T9SS type A sorting domain-containing protein [Bacteroidota bacterium]
MKKTLLLVFSLLSLSVIKASDTLTIRQVFNFEVGDTFDYEQTVYNECVGLYSGSAMRRVVTQKTYSTNQDTIYYQYAVSFPSSTIPFSGNIFIRSSAFDTITDLDSFAINLTRPINPPGNSAGCGAAQYDTTTYFSNVSDRMVIGCFESSDLVLLTNRLGVTDLDAVGGGDPCGGNGNRTRLIHFGNDSVRYDAPLGLSDQGTATYHGLYPNPAADKVYVTLPSSGATGSYLVITDLFARTVYRSDILSDQNPIDISTLSSGLYLWRLESDHGTIQTGKIVKQ